MRANVQVAVKGLPEGTSLWSEVYDDDAEYQKDIRLGHRGALGPSSQCELCEYHVVTMKNGMKLAVSFTLEPETLTQLFSQEK